LSRNLLDQIGSIKTKVADWNYQSNPSIY